MTTVPSALIVGGDGGIGSALWRQLRQTGEAVTATSRHGTEGTLALDLATAADSFPLPPNIESAFLCAATTNLAHCEDSPTESAAINVEATVTLATRLVDAGAFVLFPSSNLVFDGSVPMVDAQAPTSPLTEYGRQKAEAERRLLELGDSVAVLRLTKVVHPRLPLFLEWRQALAAGETIHPFFDLLLSPVSLELAVQAMICISEQRKGGLFQLSADRDLSYEEAAQRLVHSVGADASLVQPHSSSEAGVPLARRPSHTTLNGQRLRRECAIAPPSAESTLDAVFTAMARETA